MAGSHQASKAQRRVTCQHMLDLTETNMKARVLEKPSAPTGLLKQKARSSVLSQNAMGEGGEAFRVGSSGYPFAVVWWQTERKIVKARFCGLPRFAQNPNVKHALTVLKGAFVPFKPDVCSLLAHLRVAKSNCWPLNTKRLASLKPWEYFPSPRRTSPKASLLTAQPAPSARRERSHHFILGEGASSSRIRVRCIRRWCKSIPHIYT